MKQFESIILYCLRQLNSERTVYSIFHLLNGKKSSQTIQDAHLFSLKNFFGVYESLSREAFEKKIELMVKENQISFCGDQRYCLTFQGMSFLRDNPPPSYMDGWNYQSFTTLFWERLSLFIQVTSNFSYGETRYTPIQKNKDIHQWLKTVVKEISVPKQGMGKVIFSELIQCIDSSNEEVDPSILVFRLTGFQQIGLTPQQAAKQSNMEMHDYHISFIHVLHYLIQKIIQESNKLKILPLLTRDFNHSDELTLSSRKTWNLLTQGYLPEQIAELRHLKLSTIEDHFVEFALHVNDFSIEPYVNRELQEEILAISRQEETRQLKLIRDKIKIASYFQIRLVLAKYGGKTWN